MDVLDQVNSEILSSHVVHSWLHPLIGILKVNVDGVTNDTGGGISYVIRGFRGNFLATTAKRIHAKLTPDLIEALAMEFGMKFALDL